MKFIVNWKFYSELTEKEVVADGNIVEAASAEDAVAKWIEDYKKSVDDAAVMSWDMERTSVEVDTNSVIRRDEYNDGTNNEIRLYDISARPATVAEVTGLWRVSYIVRKNGEEHQKILSKPIKADTKTGAEKKAASQIRLEIEESTPKEIADFSIASQPYIPDFSVIWKMRNLDRQREEYVSFTAEPWNTMDTSKAIREMMLKRGKTSGEVAEQINYTKQSYSRLLRNGINRIDVLSAIAATMDYDIEITFKDLRPNGEDIKVK